MLRWKNRSKPWLAFAAMVWHVHSQTACAVTLKPSITALLIQTETLRTSDHPRFLNLLAALHQQIPNMSPNERWQLRYLDGWQASFRGDYVNADPILRDVINNSGNPALVIKASASLMNDLGSTKHYVEAFEMANQLEGNLPKTQDKLARFQVLLYISQLLRSAGQYDLAIDYARGMMQTLPPGETSCKPQAMLITILYESHKLTSSSSEIQQAINACQAASEPVITDAVWLVKGSLYLDEGKPDKAIALLNRITPGIRAAQYYYNTLEVQGQLAQAYWKLGDDNKAHAAALSVLASSTQGDDNTTLRDAYKVLYEIEKKHGNTKAALNYYEDYSAQNIGYLNDVSARAVAYDVAQQHMLAQKLETEKLNKQNNILRLQQTLAAKTIETGRLYILLLLMVLASVVFWLFRTKRSQLHFRQQARLDGLTSIFNHQHFISEAQRALRVLARKQNAACLIFIDLDYFKQINDTHGHAIGDIVLKHTVAICKQSLRTNDLFGRLGGEEFGILLLECSPAQGATIADRIRTTIEATPVNVAGHSITFSASIGLASTFTSGYELQRLCHDADAALYRAKHIGRNRVIAYAEHGDLAKAPHIGHASP